VVKINIGCRLGEIKDGTLNCFKCVSQRSEYAVDSVDILASDNDTMALQKHNIRVRSCQKRSPNCAR